ncbi:hypothetical protein E4U53_003114, partial [Claviceps sorghi]
LDTECLLPTESLEQTYGPIFKPSKIPQYDTALLGRMGTRPEFEQSIPNAWMASSPGHPFFLEAIEHVVELYNKSLAEGQWRPAEDTTGPLVLRKSVIRYEEKKIRNGPGLGEEAQKHTAAGPFSHDQNENHRLILLPSHFIYPYSWSHGGEEFRDACWVVNKAFNADQCKAKLGTEKAGSICITYWSHTHDGGAYCRSVPGAGSVHGTASSRLGTYAGLPLEAKLSRIRLYC